MSERANQLAESDDKIKHQFGAALFSSLYLASAQSRGTCFHPSKHPSIHPFVHSFVNSLPGGDGDKQRRRLALGIVSIFGPSHHLESAAERDSADWRSINQRARKFSHSLRFSRARAFICSLSSDARPSHASFAPVFVDSIRLKPKLKPQRLCKPNNSRLRRASRTRFKGRARVCLISTLIWASINFPLRVRVDPESEPS